MTGDLNKKVMTDILDRGYRPEEMMAVVSAPIPVDNFPVSVRCMFEQTIGEDKMNFVFAYGYNPDSDRLKIYTLHAALQSSISSEPPIEHKFTGIELHFDCAAVHKLLRSDMFHLMEELKETGFTAIVQSDFMNNVLRGSEGWDAYDYRVAADSRYDFSCGIATNKDTGRVHSLDLRVNQLSDLKLPDKAPGGIRLWQVEQEASRIPWLQLQVAAEAQGQRLPDDPKATKVIDALRNLSGTPGGEEYAAILAIKFLPPALLEHTHVDAALALDIARQRSRSIVLPSGFNFDQAQNLLQGRPVHLHLPENDFNGYWYQAVDSGDHRLQLERSNEFSLSDLGKRLAEMGFRDDELKRIRINLQNGNLVRVGLATAPATLQVDLQSKSVRRVISKQQRNQRGKGRGI